MLAAALLIAGEQQRNQTTSIVCPVLFILIENRFS
jgi:hypothetical protein